MRRPAVSPRIKASLQPVTYLGVAMLVCVYATLVYLITEDRNTAEKAAIRSNENLTVLFEHLIFRSFNAADSRLKLVRQVYQQHKPGMNLSKLIDGTAENNDLTFQYTIAGPDGFIKATTVGGPDIGHYVGDRTPFIVHANSTEDKLFISEPTILKTSQRRGLVLTRRINGQDGSFQGVIAATVDIAQFEKLYQQINLGVDGLASLWGTDGIVRVAGANGKLRLDIVGRKFPKAGMFAYLEHSPTDTYWNQPNVSARNARFDFIKRLVSYRKIGGFPLIVVVANSRHEIFKSARQNAMVYLSISAVLTVGIIFAIGAGTRRQWKLATATTALAQTNARFNAAIENMPHGLSMIDADRKLIISNRRYATMYGLDPDETGPGTHLNAIFRRRVAGGTPAEAAQYIDSMVEAIDKGRTTEIVTELPNGRTILISHQPMTDGGAVAIHQDITAQKESERKIWSLAHRDVLTGLANRLAFLDAVKNATELSRNGDQAFAIFLLDIDRFKEINDSLGHPIGDALLRAMAQRLEADTHEGALIARLGGDEFAILHPVADPTTAHTLARKWLQAIEEPFNVECHQLSVEASIGIAFMPEHDLDPDELIKKADLALYKAKAEGRRDYRIFEADMAEAAMSRHALLMDLRKAIEKEEFEVYYQPILDAATLEVVSIEALVRWPHPKQGLVGPDKFIPLAEDTGLISPLGDWVLRRACQEATRWPDTIKVAVNLSPVQFRMNDLVDGITAALAESGLPPQRLELEVTESVLLEHDKKNLATLRQLQHLGISIALDDFGTGYSSLSYLRQFPFNKVKIDRTFISELGQNDDCAAIVSAIATLARHLDITTTAEGVETDHHLVLLRAVGCEQVQGFLFGRPCPRAELYEMLTKSGCYKVA